MTNQLSKIWPLNRVRAYEIHAIDSVTVDFIL